MENKIDQKEEGTSIALENKHSEDKSNISSRLQNTENVESRQSKATNTTNEELFNSRQSREVQTDAIDIETVEKLKSRLDTLMNSLATLSAEKSKMEANFQIDKKQLRNERDECEKVIRDLKEKLKKAQSSNHSEIEHVKCKLIMERHEREKEQADHAKMIKELQKLLHDERKNKEQLEAQVKSQFANKTQCKILEAELEITRNKLKQAEEAAKETPPILLSLQSEMALMKKQHLNAIHEEQKRAATAEQQARALAMTHEARVAGLEARLAELSEIVGGYDKLRQQDQQAIQKLKDQLATLQDSEHNDYINLNNEPEEIISKIKNLYTKLLDLDNKKNESTHVKLLLHNLGLCDKQQVVDYKEKYDILLQEYEEYKQQWKYTTNANRSYNIQSQNISLSHDKNNKTQLHLLKAHSNNLEERIRVLNNEIMNKERELQVKLEHQQKSFQEERGKLEHMLVQKDNEYRSKISTLEQQLLRQRERSMALIGEKDKEILSLKASFHAPLSRKESIENKTDISRYENKREPVSDLMTGLLTSDSPPILHYSQELARKEIQVSTSRRKVLELEATLREKHREVIHMKEKQKEEIKALQAQIARLEACKSREGANLEYLKNVFINYLTTSDVSSKRHMLNAISTVLRFTQEELNKSIHLVAT
ncbi:D-aminoacyl-tRNA deacylase isoform X2 [Megachile rotundata]|uniref:D-aminoacyl-tRNA deacylase isoform X2 n=1 Tax=Megachile rotundata TaxID=143995 RepID=UPI000614ED97|nr:PREDICTED: GRIP and coiled-coil domain-containing protein 1 isoform X2 [Megachile rotundata]